MSVGLVGTGTIGASLLGMLADQREVLRTQFHLDVQIRAVANAEKVSLEGASASRVLCYSAPQRGADVLLAYEP